MNSVKSKSLIKYVATFLLSGILLFACQTKQDNEQSTQVKTVNSNPEIANIDIHAAVMSGDEGTIKQYIAGGGDLNVKEPMGGSTPLISAAVFNQPNAVRLLIHAGADLNLQNKDGSTALLSAAFFGRTEIVQLLVQAGADQSLKNNFGSTPLQSVQAPLSQLMPIYKQIKNDLAPFGFKLDLDQLEVRRNEVVKILTQ